MKSGKVKIVLATLGLGVLLQQLSVTAHAQSGGQFATATAVTPSRIKNRVVTLGCVPQAALYIYDIRAKFKEITEALALALQAIPVDPVQLATLEQQKDNLLFKIQVAQDYLNQCSPMSLGLMSGSQTTGIQTTTVSSDAIDTSKARRGENAIADTSVVMEPTATPKQDGQPAPTNDGAGGIPFGTDKNFYNAFRFELDARVTALNTLKFKMPTNEGPIVQVETKEIIEGSAKEGTNFMSMIN